MIGSSAFYGCQRMTSATIPASVVEIGESAFAGCYSLRDVYYQGTEAQWEDIEIRSINDWLMNAQIHFLGSAGGNNVTISDTTGGAATVSAVVDSMFTVTCDSACVVAYTTDGGHTYTKLTGIGTGDVRSFTLPETDEEIVVAVVLKGDVMLTGSVSTTDVTQLKRFIAGKRGLDPLQELAADVTGEGKVNTTDVTQLKRFITGNRTFE